MITKPARVHGNTNIKIKNSLSERTGLEWVKKINRGNKLLIVGG
jgi:hypothetical protein